MKTIYESILSSTNSGKKKIVEDLENWLKAAFDSCTGNVFSINRLYSIDIKPKNGGYAVDIDTEWTAITSDSTHGSKIRTNM